MGDIEEWLVSEMAVRLHGRILYTEKDIERIAYKMFFKNGFDEKIIEGYVFPMERREELRQKIDSVFNLNDKIEQEIAKLIKETFDEVYFGSALREKRKIDIQGLKADMYKNFFHNYDIFSQSMEIVASDKYQDYLKIRNTKELKALIRKYKES